MWKKIVAVLMGLIVGYWLIDDFDPRVLQRKKVLITGASTGIGEQMAYHFAKYGADVVVTARRKHKLQEVVSRCREIGDIGGHYDYITADMSDLTSIDRVIKEAIDKLGGLDFLMLNHIMMLPIAPWMGSPENLTLLDQVMDINFKAYVHLASHSLPHLEKSRGSIIVVSSLIGKMGQPFLAEYSASKFALDGFFSGLRQELRVRNCDITITLCVIGFVGTENAIQGLQESGQQFLIDMVSPAKPSDAALAIIKGGVKRSREIFFPYMQTKSLVLLRDWLPEFVDYLNRVLFIDVTSSQR